MSGDKFVKTRYVFSVTLWIFNWQFSRGSGYDFESIYMKNLFDNKYFLSTGSNFLVTKFTLAKIFRDTWERSLVKEELLKSLELAVISPWDANRPDYAKCGASILYKDPPQVIHRIQQDQISL